MAKYTKCPKPTCDNFQRWAKNPRSQATPDHCGMCGTQVEFLECPECGNIDLFKMGYVYTRKGKLQRYFCKTCCKTFSLPIMEVA